MEAKTAITAIVTVLLLLITAGTLYPILGGAATDLTAEGNCADASTTCFYNTSRGAGFPVCTENNNTNDIAACSASNYLGAGGLPLGGALVVIIPLLFAALLFFGIYKYLKK